jgi:hypothetical protein
MVFAPALVCALQPTVAARRRTKEIDVRRPEAKRTRNHLSLLPLSQLPSIADEGAVPVGARPAQVFDADPGV